MKVLLDENLPHDLRALLAPHAAVTASYLRWKGVRNSELLARAAAHGFDALLTMDVGMAHGQKHRALPVAVVVVRAPSNSMDHLRPMVARIVRALESVPPCTLVEVE